MTRFHLILLPLLFSWFSYCLGELEVSDLSDQPPSVENTYRDQAFNEEELLKVVDELSVKLTNHTERTLVSEAALQRRQNGQYPNGVCPRGGRFYFDIDEDTSCNAKWGIATAHETRTFGSTGSVCAGPFRRITCACCFTTYPITDNDVPRMDGIYCPKWEVCKQEPQRWSKWGKLVPHTSCVQAKKLTEILIATKKVVKEYCTPKRWLPSTGKGKNAKFHAWAYNYSTGQLTKLKWMYLKLDGQYAKSASGISEWGLTYSVNEHNAIELCGYPSDDMQKNSIDAELQWEITLQ
uniref:Secreted in xylem 13 n=3 Tax=Fusarium oxysporum f. sp. pisi TaxID=179143 RepID=A0A7G5XAT9_FUSOX|nr:secreted in xylem 13 [Fusarium oxysporum f. sp. pisi]BDB04140.1 secreted in xylem 13 [Fusarium oxysporum f. sp. pisi]BDB04141.1 secreted in xylem 13 [Fusarium oxysporum f. sp. pisi]BDB04142.1 secreted in xylem 13 [Fusarium oxysporum f. sp. pisi]BDB04143.1 secreted in xylem 13 [Fusarium oxysporum f. sp. pisi]